MLKLKIVNEAGQVLCESAQGDHVSLVYHAAYAPGDRVVVESTEPGVDCLVQLEDSLAPSLVLLRDKTLVWKIPFEQQRIIYSPKAFTGELHLVKASLADPEDVYSWRNLALNCYDAHGEEGAYPHASANVETRGESVFAAQNAIDGIYENCSHGAWPYQSWGINRDPKAEWHLEFGREVTLDQLRITLRADYPHDSYWTQGKVSFSDGSELTLSFEKTERPQVFEITPRTVTSLCFHSLIKAEDESPFPALTQFEAWGTVEG